MDYKILASDYDNTLVPFGEACPRPAVQSAIRRMQAEGNLFVLSTGRCYASVNKPGQLGKVKMDYAITCNGAYVADKNGRCVASHPMTNEEMYALTDFCENYEFPLMFAYSDGYYVYEGYEEMIKIYCRVPQAGFVLKDGEDRVRHLIDMPFGAHVRFSEEGYKTFEEKYGYLGLHFMAVGPHNKECQSYDIVREGVDKGTGLADLCAALNIPLQASVATGDSSNDCGMLRMAGLGCCMSNGTEDAKAAADRVIGDVREDGVAALIEELWFGGETAKPSGGQLGSAWGNAE